MTTTKLTSVELFAGGGGLALGTRLAGFEPIVLAERDRWSCETLRANHPGTVIEGDVRDINWALIDRTIDLLAAGPPCQPFSTGGLARAAADSRDMFPTTVDVIRQIEPRAFIIENVRGLTRAKFSGYLSQVVESLTDPGAGLRYDVAVNLVNAADYGVPQNRWRVFLIGFRDDIKTDWAFPAPSYVGRHSTVGDALLGLPEPTAEDTPGFTGHVYQPGARTYPGHTGSPLDAPAKAIKAGAHGVPGGENMIRHADGTVRYLTVREASRVQTFPDSYVFSGPWGEAMRQLGNAVPVRLAQVVSESVMAALEGKEQN